MPHHPNVLPAAALQCPPIQLVWPTPAWKLSSGEPRQAPHAEFPTPTKLLPRAPTLQLQRAGQEDAKRAATHHNIHVSWPPQLVARSAHKLRAGPPDAAGAQRLPGSVGAAECLIAGGSPRTQSCTGTGTVPVPREMQVSVTVLIRHAAIPLRWLWWYM